MQVYRYFILAPLGIPHRAMKDVTLNGYYIPKVMSLLLNHSLSYETRKLTDNHFVLQDTIVLFDLHSVHYDKAHWDKPNEFLPQRFLDEGGKFRQNNVSIPFGLGKSNATQNYYVVITVVTQRVV